MEGTKYRISKPRSQDLRYGQNDLKPVIGGAPEPIPREDESDEDDDDDGDGGDAVAAQAKADKEAKAATNKKAKEDADAAVIAKYKGKKVKAPDGEGEDGKVVAVARRKVGGRRQFRVQVKWPDLPNPKWYSRQQIDPNLIGD